MHRFLLIVAAIVLGGCHTSPKASDIDFGKEIVVSGTIAFGAHGWNFLEYRGVDDTEVTGLDTTSLAWAAGAEDILPTVNGHAVCGLRLDEMLCPTPFLIYVDATGRYALGSNGEPRFQFERVTRHQGVLH